MDAALVKTPVYQQLNALLRESIRQGEFAPGDRFLTERQVCERFGVSRATANKAISNLVAEGVLVFRKGVGTFVGSGLLQYDTRVLVSFTEKAQVAGKTPSTRVRSLRLLTGEDLSAPVHQALRLHSRDQVYYAERIRLADETPVILEHRYIVERHCPNLRESDLAGSLYALWTTTYHLEIAGADEIIRAVALQGEEARLLAVRNGTAGFLVISTGYLTDETPLWWENTWYRGDLYEFHNRLGPLQTAYPALGALRRSSDE
jgi:GntR family transcriptional regulator